MDENQVKNTEQKVEQKVPEKKEPTAAEQRALEMGWRPKEEFDGPEEEFIDAAEFVRRRPLFDKIESQNKQIKQLHKGLEDLKGLYGRVKDMEYNRAVATLKAARKEAARENDYDRVDAIETEIERVQTEANTIKQEIVKTTPAPVVPEFVDWQKKNNWYQKDDGMTLFADALGAKLVTKGYGPSEVLAEIDKQVRSEFPHKFRNPNKEHAPSVSESDTTAKSKSEGMKLDSEQERTMKRFVRLGVMTEKEYIQSIKDLESGQ